MNAPSLEERMDNLERIVEPLRELPDRVTKVEGQIVQLRTEMRGEFSAIRRDLARFATRDDLARIGRGLRRQVRGLHTLMLVLHEDIVERLKILGDAWARPRATPRKRPKKAR